MANQAQSPSFQLLPNLHWLDDNALDCMRTERHHHQLTRQNLPAAQAAGDNQTSR